MQRALDFAKMFASLEADGPSISTTGSFQSLLNSQAHLAIPGDALNGLGRRLHVHGSGILTSASGATTYTFILQTVGGGVVLYTSGALTLTTAARTGIPFDFELNLSVRATGTAGTFKGMFKATTQDGTFLGPAPVASSGLDLTIFETLDFGVNLSGGSMQLTGDFEAYGT